MTSPTDLPTDLQHEIAARVDPPGFEEVLALASAARRRRRTAIGAGLAAAVVIGGLAFAIGEPGGPGRSSEPAGTRPGDGGFEVDPRLPAEVREVLAGAERVIPWVVSGSGGATAAVMEACDEYDQCQHVAVTRTGEEVAGVALEGNATMLTPVPDGWVMDGADDDPRRLTVDGTLQPLRLADGDPADVAAGDTAVSTGEGPRLLRGDQLLAVPAPTGSMAHNGYVTPAGRLVVVSFLEGRLVVSASDDARSWETTRIGTGQNRAASAFVAGHGDHVAVVALGDGADGSIPVLGVQVSHDAGSTWDSIGDLGPGAGPRNVSAFAVSADGTTFLTTESHGLVRIDTDGRATVERTTSSHDTSVFADGARVCLVAEAGPIDRLQCSTDDGTTWEAEPLPGFR